MAINNVGRAMPLPSQPSKPADGIKEVGINGKASTAKAAGTSGALQLSGAATSQAKGAGEPPVDAARVAALKAAIEDGSYQVDPEQVARSMVDFEQKLNSE